MRLAVARGMVWRGIALFLGIFSICRAAAAEPVREAPTEPTPAVVAPPHSRPPAAREEPERRWYGWQILIPDGVSGALLAVAIANEKTIPTTLPLSLAGYGLGGPIVHGAHGRWGAAGVSLLLRGALPLGGIMVGMSGCTPYREACGETAALLGVTAMAVASIIDAAALSSAKLEPVRAAALSPALGMTPSAAWVGATGQF